MILILIAVLLAPVLLLGAEAFLARNGTEVDTPDVATLTARDVSAGSTEELRLVWLGDSTTAAVGTTNARHAVSSLVGKQLSKACATTVATRVIAKSGAQISDVLRDQLPVARTMGGDIAVISVGANDTIQLTSLTRFTRMYRELIDGLVDAGFTPERIVVLGVPDMGSPPRLAQPLRAIVGLRSRALDRRAKAVVGEKRTSYVDLFAGTSKIFRGNPSRYFAADKYHPSDAGYVEWARVITPVVKKVCSNEIS